LRTISEPVIWVVSWVVVGAGAVDIVLSFRERIYVGARNIKAVPQCVNGFL